MVTLLGRTLPRTKTAKRSFHGTSSRRQDVQKMSGAPQSIAWHLDCSMPARVHLTPNEQAYNQNTSSQQKGNMSQSASHQPVVVLVLVSSVESLGLTMFLQRTATRQLVNVTLRQLTTQQRCLLFEHRAKPTRYSQH